MMVGSTYFGSCGVVRGVVRGVPSIEQYEERVTDAVYRALSSI